MKLIKFLTALSLVMVAVSPFLSCIFSDRAMVVVMLIAFAILLVNTIMVTIEEQRKDREDNLKKFR